MIFNKLFTRTGFRLLLAMITCNVLLNRANAQSPSDAIMMPGREACVLLNYDYGTFDQYWEGGKLRFNRTIATVNRTTIMPMVAVGILDRLNFYVGLPYVSTGSTEPNGGHLEGAKGLQDLSLALKYQLLNKKMGKNELTAFATGSFSTPASNYLSDYMPYSLGFGAPELGLRGIVQYKLGFGLYARATGAYLWRGYTEAERDYYYNNGSAYTAWMDVPSAWNYDGTVGVWLFKNALQLEATYMGLKSTSGDDIRAYNAPQPTNKVEFDRVGVFAHYFLPRKIGLGVVAYYNQVISGLNTAKATGFGGGITYQFNYLKKKNND